MHRDSSRNNFYVQENRVSVNGKRIRVIQKFNCDYYTPNRDLRKWEAI